MRMTIPTQLTLMRIALIPVVGILIYIDGWWTYLASAALFGLAAITDWLDGYLARKLGQMTPFGAFLDPVADKLIVATALVLLVEIHASAILAVPALVIVGREIVVSALREWMSEYSERRSVAVSFLGKVKTTFQMIAIIVLLATGPDLSNPLVTLGYVLLYLAAALTLWSMYQYLKLAWPDLYSGMTNEKKARK